MRRLDNTQELLDGPLDQPILEGNLRDLARVNRWLGGTELSWQALLGVVGGIPLNRPVTVLDVGTGAADIPLGLARRARQAGRRLQIKATDVRPEILELAGRRLAGEPDVSLAAASAERIAERDSSFDVVHASLLLHHLEMNQARQLLVEMARVARRAVIINDLDRARHWWLAAWLLSRVTTGNRYTRHDAPLSVRRAYRPNEVLALAAHAGLRERSRLTALPGYRYAIVLS